MIELSDTPIKQTTHESECTSSIVSTPAQVTLSSHQFALLYGSDRCETGVSYPPLPDGTPQMCYNGNMLESQPPPYDSCLGSQLNEGVDDEQEDESAPFLAPTISKSDPHSQQQPVTCGDPADDVMSDLVVENLRLQQELQSLQDSMAPTSNSSTYYYQQQNLQQSQQQHRSQDYVQHPSNTQYTQHTQQSQTSTVSNSTQQQQVQEHLKYVCCGNCQQWLSAPRDAMYVYCPGCEAVNNCSQAPPPTQSQPPRPPARRLDAQPWYLQCISSVLS